MGKVVALDTETTGLSNHKVYGHPQVIELAYIELNDDLFSIDALTITPILEWINECSRYKERFRPSMQIHRDATNVHGIFFKDLIGFRKSEDIVLPKLKYVVAHNASYDVRCLNRKDIPTICTMALAKAIDKQFNLKFESHKLDDLISTLYGNEADEYISAKHTALNDVIKVILLLTQLLVYLPGIKSFDSLFQFQQGLKKSKKVVNV